jgi:hypothetical protein
MKRILASLVAAVLMVSAVSADTQTTKGYWMEYTSKLPIGSTVHVRTTDGKRITGVLAIVNDTGITVQSKTRVPEPPRHVPFDQLEQVELKTGGSSLGKAVGIGVGVGVGSFLGMLAILAALWSD